ncbi:MAG TPA: hypothetical protein VMI31_04930 [Fimbriimonadaceae bacterium]|nr:hypothetical protein [Fimbriimonadaceae bacterium]
MYFTIGSALTIVAAIFGTAFSAWALLVGSSLIFRHKAQISQSLIQHAPFRSFFLGAVLLFVMGFVSAIFLTVPIPAVKFFGYSGMFVIVSLASLGAGGLVLFVAERLRQYDPRLRPFVALNRGALVIVASGLVPVFGLFVVFPAVLAIGLGTAAQAIFMRQEITVWQGEEANGMGR